MATALTPTQERVLEFVAWYLAENGYAPSTADVMRHMGAKSTNAASDWIKALVRKNLLHRTPVIARGLRITGEGRTALERIAERKALSR